MRVDPIHNFLASLGGQAKPAKAIFRLILLETIAGDSRLLGYASLG